MTLGEQGACLIRLGESCNNACEMEYDHTQKKFIIDDTAYDPGYDYRDTTCHPKVIEKYGALWCEAWKGCDIVDTTGAGDAFQGGFLVALWTHALSESLHTNNRNDESNTSIKRPISRESRHYLAPTTDKMILARALRIGTSVAARKLEKLGAREGLPGRDDPFLREEFKLLK